jgi:hypothetical protein
MKRVLALAIATIVLCAIPGDASDPGGRCASAKLKATARKTSTKLKCFATAYARELPIDQACLSKAEVKFSAAWQRIEAAGGCRTTQDEHETEIQVDALVSILGVKLAPCGSVGGTCGGICPFGLNCFEIGVGCFGEPEPCRCHGSTTTCPSTTSTSTTLP